MRKNETQLSGTPLRTGKRERNEPWELRERWDAGSSSLRH